MQPNVKKKKPVPAYFSTEAESLFFPLNYWQVPLRMYDERSGIQLFQYAMA